MNSPKLKLEKSPWTVKTAQLLTNDTLIALFDGAIPAIILPNFLSPSDCGRIVANLATLGMGTYSHVNHSVGRLGLAQMEYHLKKSKDSYFSAVQDACATYHKATQGSEDPIQKLIGQLAHSTSTDVRIAEEGSSERYFAGTFRNVMTLGHLHFDFAPFEARGWDIAKIQSQLSWNLYLNQPSGGNLKVYNRFYNPEDEKLRVEGEYFYDRQIVANSEQFSYAPKVGDLVLFNSRNIHEVEPVTGNRYSLSSFVGKTNDQSLILWS